MSDMETPTTTPARRTWSGTPRWAKWLLSISLALNFVVIGLAIGAAAKFHKHGHSHGGIATIGQIMRALPDDSKDVARDMLQAARPDFKALRAERRAAKLAVAEAIKTTPYDASAVNKAFAELREKDQITKASAHGVMVEILEVLSPEDRAAVAKGLSKRKRKAKR